MRKWTPEQKAKEIVDLFKQFCPEPAAGTAQDFALGEAFKKMEALAYGLADEQARLNAVLSDDRLTNDLRGDLTSAKGQARGLKDLIKNQDSTKKDLLEGLGELVDELNGLDASIDAISAHMKAAATGETKPKRRPKAKVTERRGHEVTLKSAKDIGALVANRRAHFKLKQEELGARTGASRKYINELEAGKPNARVGLILDVLAGLGTSLVARHG